MKKALAILLAIITAFTATAFYALSESLYWFDAVIYGDSFSDGSINIEYLESVAPSSRYGTGCVPYIIESWEEYDRIFIPDPDNSDGERDEVFYDTHATAIIHAWAPTLGHNYEVTAIGRDNGILTIHYTCILPSGAAPDAVQSTIIAVTFNREDFEGSVSVSLVPTLEYQGAIEFKAHQFDDGHFGEEYYDGKDWQYLMYGSFNEPTIITDAEALAAIVNASGSDDFAEYAGKLDSDYFEQGALLVQFAPAPDRPTEYFVERVTVLDETELALVYTYTEGVSDAIQESVIVVEVNKADVENCEYTYASVARKLNIVGDVDGNGFIEPYDYIYAKRAYFGTLALEGEMLARADANSDGIVDQYDYILIKRIYFGTYRVW